MAYQQLILGEMLPRRVEKLIRISVDELLADVHCCLRLPTRRPNLPRALRFTVGHTLRSVVAGVSTAFYKRGLSDGKAFIGLLVDYYPWRLEPSEAVDVRKRSTILLKTFRNSFAHSLGLAYEKKGPTSRELVPRKFQLKIGRGKAGMSKRALVALERSLFARPNLKPTVVVESHKRVLWVESFYWGLRVMMYQLTCDASLMAELDRYYADVEARPKKAA